MQFEFSDRISTLQPSAIREILKATSQPGVIPFAAGNPAPEAFPTEEVREITEKLLTRSTACNMASRRAIRLCESVSLPI